MEDVIAKYQDGGRIEFGRGKFDAYCVYIVDASGRRRAPTDENNFVELRELVDKFGSEKVLRDFSDIYDATAKSFDRTVMGLIDKIAASYGDSGLRAHKLFTVLYAAMIAEENKAGTRLGKRIKRLGVHQVVIAAAEPGDAANYSKGKTWKELDAEMKKLGF